MTKTKKIELQPFLSRGEAFLGPDGKVYLVPIQLFRSSDGKGVRLRIGENLLWFNEDGSYDGPEAHLSSIDTAEEYKQALGSGNRNEAPERAYFQPGTIGWEEETKDWPKSNLPS